MISRFVYYMEKRYLGKKSYSTLTASSLYLPRIFPGLVLVITREETDDVTTIEGRGRRPTICKYRFVCMMRIY